MLKYQYNIIFASKCVNAFKTFERQKYKRPNNILNVKQPNKFSIFLTSLRQMDSQAFQVSNLKNIKNVVHKLLSEPLHILIVF